MSKTAKLIILSAGGYCCYRVGKIVGMIDASKIWVETLDEKFPEANVKWAVCEHLVEKVFKK